MKCDLAVIDARRLEPAERQRYDEALWLRKEALRLIKEAGSEEDVDIAVMLERAVTLLAPLVSRALELDWYVAILNRYRETGSIPDGFESPDQLYSRTLPLVAYVGQNRERLGAAGSSLEKLTPGAAAAAVVFQTDLASVSPQGSRLLLATDTLLQALDDAHLPPMFRKTWHLAVAGHLQGQGELLPAIEHAGRATARFPQDPEVLVAAGALDEMLASRHVAIPAPGPQIGFVQSRALVAGTAILKRHRRDGLKMAEAAYRKALAAEPQSAEARLRLGRVFALTGRGDAALAELEAASAAGAADWRTRYLSALFSGAVHEGAGRWSLAVDAYRRAGEHGGVVTAAIALSHALHAAGERELAGEVLERGLIRDRAEQRSDPWWDYPLGAWRLRNPRLRELREAIR